LPKETGNEGCNEKHARWYFSPSDNKCMPFYYNGCGGNENNYESETSCADNCPSVVGEDNIIKISFILTLKFFHTPSIMS
jgi:hypothetical protein